MSLPYLIVCKAPAVGLYELTDGRFQLIQQGPIAPVMAGFQYLLIEESLASFLEGLGIERVSYETAVIFNRKSGEEFRTHVRVRVGQFFRPEEVNDIALSGLRFLTMNEQYYFVSPDLKLKLEASNFEYLDFSEGLSSFAGNLA